VTAAEFVINFDPVPLKLTCTQVFTSAAASGILTNDLVSIMESTEVTGIEADTVDDNIFQWNVRVKSFTQNWFVSSFPSVQNLS
jgi:hypothetical protein